MDTLRLKGQFQLQAPKPPTVCLTRPETIEQTITDFLGDSMWDFRHDTRTIRAKIVDSEWLQKFQSRSEQVRPGDAIRADVSVEAKYGYDGEVIAFHYRVEKIHEVIPAEHPHQDGLFHS